MREIRRRRPSVGAVVALVALVAAIAGAAVAAIPGPGGEIHGCFNRANGNLRVVEETDGCRKNESAITWNQAGPKGDIGATGPAGASGARGATGPTGPAGAGPTVYEDHAVASQPITGGVHVAGVTVPAGRYLVSAKTSVGDTSGIRNFVQCGLDGDPFQATNEASRATLPPVGFAALTALAAIDVTVATTIEFFCNPDAPAEARFTVLTATSVGMINAQ